MDRDSVIENSDELFIVTHIFRINGCFARPAVEYFVHSLAFHPRARAIFDLTQRFRDGRPCHANPADARRSKKQRTRKLTKKVMPIGKSHEKGQQSKPQYTEKDSAHTICL